MKNLIVEFELENILEDYYSDKKDDEDDDQETVNEIVELYNKIGSSCLKM